MPPWKKDTPLRDGMLTNPVLHIEQIDMTGIPEPSVEDLDKIFNTPASALKTWARDKDKKLVDDPHWLCVKKGVKMHIDTGFPRYSHQLKVKVDDKTFVRGVDGYPTRLVRGTFYILDTHSPHEVFTEDGAVWNVTASIDDRHIHDPAAVLPRLIEFAKKTHILEGAPV